MLAHVTKTGNISIPKKWRDELGIEPNSSVIIEKTDHKVVIEPLKSAFKKIDEEMKKNDIHFTRAEAVSDDLYD